MLCQLGPDADRVGAQLRFAVPNICATAVDTVVGMTEANVTCPSCGAVGAIEPGFLEDRGEGSRGYLRWIAGPLERGVFGGAKVMGKQRFIVEAFRCGGCGLLSMFAREAS